LLKKLGASLFFNKYCEKVVQREKKTGRLKNLLPFQPGFVKKRPKFLSLPKRENSWREISQI